MAEFFSAIWENFVQFATAFAIFIGFLIGVAWLVSKTTWFANRIEKRRIKRRLETCPQKAFCDVLQAKQDTQIKEMKTLVLMAQGGTIALHCAFAIQRGYLPLYDRVWLQNAYDEYTKAGGNHGVDQLFNQAMALPEFPPKNRRCTD